jgi:nucleotide-binding universal stress UspA family protein
MPERNPRHAQPHDIFAESSDAQTAAREQLAKLVPRTGSRRPVFTRLHVLESNDVAAAICQAAERLDAAVICLGTRARSGFAKALVGSVAEGVVRGTQRPVLLARKPVE